MTSVAQKLITAPIARQIMASETKKGYYFNLPTMAEIEAFYHNIKGWWSLRDIMIRKFNSMSMLEPPFGNDKDSQQDHGLNLDMSNDQDEYSVDPGPFDTITLSISMAAKLRAYANAYPTDEKHTGAVLREYGKFGNAVLDMQSKKHDYIPEDTSRLINTGWLIKMFPFDGDLLKRGDFPFQIESPSPLGVYPDLDIHGQVIRVCIERRLTGSQLLHNYASYPGVRELFDGEFGFGKDLPPADSTAFKEWSSKKNNLLTTEFLVVRYYDRVATAILVNGTSITDTAAKYNPALKALKDRSGTATNKKLVGIYTKAKDRDNPWYGVAAHNMGRVPMVVEFCWPEVRDSNTSDPDTDVGRYGGLPLMYSGYNTWREISRYFSMLQNLLLKTATAPIVTNIENFNLDSDVIYGGDNGKAVYMQPPQVQQQIAEVMGRLQQAWDKSTYPSALSGQGPATSGRERDMVVNSGGVRFDHLTRKIGRAWSNTLEGITQILRESYSDVEIQTWGTGKKYDGQPYVQKFKAAMAGGTCPGMTVELKRMDAMTDPERIAIFKTADGILPARVAYDEILEVPNPDQMYEDIYKEKIDTEQTNMQPDVEVGALEKQVKAFPKKKELTWKLQEMQDVADHEDGLKQIALDLSQLPTEVVEARQRAFLEQKMQEASTPPGQGQGQGTNPFTPGSPTGGPFSSGGPNGMPPMSGGSTPPPNGLPPSPFNSAGPMPMGRPGIPPSPMGPGGPMPMMQPQPAPPPPMGPGLGRRIATAPGQAQQPIQPLSRFMPSGGVGAPGVPARLVGPQGLPGQPVALPRIEAANQAAAPILPLPTVGLGKQRNGKRRRAK